MKFNVKSVFTKAVRAMVNAVSEDRLDKESDAVLRQVEVLWWDFIEDPYEGFGVGNEQGGINYTGASKAGIQVSRPSLSRLDVFEVHDNLENIRRGSPASGRFDPKVYQWAWTKILGMDTGQIGSGRNDSLKGVRKQARQMTFAVAYNGTSAQYAKDRQFPGSTSPRGFDYPNAFLYYKQDELQETLDRSGLKIANSVRDAVLSVGI